MASLHQILRPIAPSLRTNSTPLRSGGSPTHPTSRLLQSLRLFTRFLIPASVSSAIIFFCSACPAQAPSAASITGARRYTQFCAGCHGADGKGGDKAASIATTQSVISRSDAELFRIVRDGTRQGMPPFAQIGDANIAAVVHYLRILQQNAVPASASGAVATPGNTSSGRALFFGKAGCSSCHMVRGQGGFIAPNLTTYARNRSAPAILDAITAPDASLMPNSQVVTVTTAAGRKITGILRNEDAFDLALQTQDGRYRFFSRSALSSVAYSGHSLMPRDYGTRLAPGELSDIVAFLIASSRELQGPGPRAEDGQSQ